MESGVGKSSINRRLRCGICEGQLSTPEKQMVADVRDLCFTEFDIFITYSTYSIYDVKHI